MTEQFIILTITNFNVKVALSLANHLGAEIFVACLTHRRDLSQLFDSFIDAHTDFIDSFGEGCTLLCCFFDRDWSFVAKLYGVTSLRSHFFILSELPLSGVKVFKNIALLISLIWSTHASACDALDIDSDSDGTLYI